MYSTCPENFFPQAEGFQVEVINSKQVLLEGGFNQTHIDKIYSQTAAGHHAVTLKTNAYIKKFALRQWPKDLTL